MSGKKEADLVGEVSGIPYFLLRLLTDLSLVPDSEVMLEVRGEEEERRGEEKESLPRLHIQKETPGSVSINHNALALRSSQSGAKPHAASKRAWKPVTSPLRRQEMLFLSSLSRGLLLLEKTLQSLLKKNKKETHKQ